MDLVSTIRKEGSRGGVNFSWDDVQTSSHRENYLGHSLKAPVGRWQKGRDLSWYSKAGEEGHDDAEKKRKEEIRLIKEAEEDALARAMGLPVPDRNGGDGAAMGTGANNVGIGGEVRKMVGDVGVGAEGEEKGRAFGEFMGKIGSGDVGEFLEGIQGAGEGGLVGGKDRDARDEQRRDREAERDLKKARRREREGDRNLRKEERRVKESSRDHKEDKRSRGHERDHNRHDRWERDRVRDDRRTRGRSQSPDRSRADDRNRSRDRNQRGRSRSPAHKRREYRDRSREPVRKRSRSGETGGRRDERRRRDRNIEY